MEELAINQEIMIIKKEISEIQNSLKTILGDSPNREDWEIQLIGIDNHLTITLNDHTIFEYVGPAHEPFKPPKIIHVYDSIYRQLADSHAKHGEFPEFTKASEVADSIKNGEKLSLKFIVQNTALPDGSDSNMMYRFRILWKGYAVLPDEHENFGQKPDKHTEVIEYEISHSSHVPSNLLQLIKKV